jgi:hypothetical protein
MNITVWDKVKEELEEAQEDIGGFIITLPIALAVYAYNSIVGDKPDLQKALTKDLGKDVRRINDKVNAYYGELEKWLSKLQA